MASWPYAGWQIKIPVTKGNGIGANGIVDEVKIRDVILAGVHNAHLWHAAVGIGIVLRKIANQIIRILGNSDVISLNHQ